MSPSQIQPGNHLPLRIPRRSSTCQHARPPLRRITQTALLAAAAVAFSASFAAPSGAAPARYVHEMCDSALPGGGDTGVHFTANSPPFSPNNTCSQPGGSLGITETGNLSYTYSFWSVPLAAPPGGSIETTTISGATCNNGQGNIKAFVFEQGFPSNCAAESQHIFYGGGLGGFWIFLGCTLGSGSCSAGPWIYAHYFAATEVDPVAPKLANLRGSLLGDGIVRGQQNVGVDAHDQGGGLTNVSLFVNGLLTGQPKSLSCNVVYANNPSVKGSVAVTPTPCPTDTTADWTLDTESAPFHSGINTVQLCASDFATLSNPNTTCSPFREIEVDNTCVNSPVAGGTQLSAQFTSTHTDTATVDYGSAADVVGRLTTNAGDPVAGATLCVKAQITDVDAKPVSAGTVKTDPNGRYAYTVPAGPNREISIGYRHDTSQVARDVRFYAHAQPAFDATPHKLTNRHTVRFSGSVPGPSNGSRVVVLQANLPESKRWITFRRANTDSGGRFRSHYRFNSTTRTTNYRFRAILPVQAGYPWLEGTSEAVKVRVKGCTKHKLPNSRIPRCRSKGNRR
jgi:hypothetical protein